MGIVDKKNVKVFFVISDATISPQLLEIVKTLKDAKVKQRIIFVGSSQNPLGQEILSSDVSVRFLSINSKFQLVLNSFTMLWLLLIDRPTCLLASGQFATFLSLPSSFILGIRKRIYIRHHSIFHHRYKMLLAIKLDKLMNFFATKIVAVSQVVSDVLKNVEGVSAEKIEIIYNGVDFQRFQDSNRLPMSAESNFKVGVISRLTEWKGVEYTALAFCQFFKKHPNSSLHIIGSDGGSKSKIQDILRNLPKRAYVFEDMNPNVPDFLNSINVLVHVPLRHDDEAFGIVYIEALLSGTPGIFTISGILNEINNPEKYFSVVPHGNANSIAQELESYYFQEVKLERTPLEWLKKFDLSIQGKHYLRLIGNQT